MATQQVTINLPEAIFHQLIRLAEATRQPLETLVTQSVVSNLPPMVEQVSPEMQVELLKMQVLSVEELLAIANRQIDPETHRHHVKLLDKNQQGDLSIDEQDRLMALQAICDRLMLQKAYAWSMLRWRGYPIPSVRDLPVAG
jgi:hypothetical protein